MSYVQHNLFINQNIFTNFIMTTPSSVSSNNTLIQRIERLEQLIYEIQSNFDISLYETTLRIKKILLSSRLPGCILYKVPQDYYTHSLQWRAKQLGTTPDHLCKTIIFENLSLGNDGIINNLHAPLYQQKYIAIIVQYISKVNLDILARYLASAGKDKTNASPSSSVKLAMASPETILPLTGFSFNGITPFGCHISIPIIISKSIMELSSPSYIWLGGGEVDIKLRVYLHSLIHTPGIAAKCLNSSDESYKPVVLDCTELRDTEELLHIDE